MSDERDRCERCGRIKDCCGNCRCSVADLYREGK